MATSKINGETESFMKPLTKAVRSARAEGRDWKNDLYHFLLNYLTAQQLSPQPNYYSIARLQRNFLKSLMIRKEVIPNYNSKTLKQNRK